MNVRRVVTGKNAEGKSVFVSDSVVEPVRPLLTPGAEFHTIWGSDTIPQLPQDGTLPPFTAWFPPAGGYRFGFFSVAPESAGPPHVTDMAAAFADLEAKLPGLAGHMEPDAPGMHTTNTIDVEYVISGEVWLELDDGAEVRLGPGDTIVQNGTRHAWRNKGEVPCRLALVLIGAEPPK